MSGTREVNLSKGERLAIVEVLEEFGPWAYGDTPDDAVLTAADWQVLGFTAEDVRRWLAARCWDPDAAFMIRGAGHGPDWAAVPSPEAEGTGHYLDSRGYKIANSDLTLEECERADA